MTAPRLLDKKTINKEIAAQTKQQITSGVKMAKKVDAIRETLAEEEQRLEQFRVASTKEVKREIDALISKRDALHKEIKELEKERAFLKIPPDEEWEKVKSAYLKYSDDVASLESAKVLVAQQIGENTLAAHDIEVERGRIAEMKRTAEEKLQQAHELLTDAQSTSIHLEKRAQATLEAAEAREKVVIFKEEDIEKREKEVARERERIEEMQKDLFTREQTLKDRYARLERDIKRLQK